ncbi:hypothetical protein MSC49_12870 [Methylosinus sp. C49]|jgi:hypothetical protein|uniref:DUF1097 domain-containing protein n=1 Tax=Methylosinus sp. C49 TaxID=2699395 RepID=UPI00136789B2|nr:DUF1097 domain-containing protein [Methylosinus sp. C49]BBU61352.1 hypothetical protein MSC49_12870 [Methylosinus sp. C49]
MSIAYFRAVSVGALGGLAAFLALGPAAPYGAQLFAALIGWAGYMHLGGQLDGLKKSVPHNLLGVALAAVALLAATHLPYGEAIGVAAWTAIAIGVTLVALVLSAKLPALAQWPVSLAAYATLLATTRADEISALTAGNPALLAALSLIVGAILGYAADQLAEALSKLPLPGQKAPSVARG